MRNAIRLFAPNKSVPHHLSSWAMAVAIVVFGVAVTGTQSARAQTYNVLYSFTGGADGANPIAPLVLDAAGNLYGTTEYGGGTSISGGGTVFKLTPVPLESRSHEPGEEMN